MNALSIHYVRYSPITETPHKRLRPVFRPVIFVVEHARIPNHLEKQLAHAYRM